MLIDQVFLYFLIAAGLFVSLPALWLLMLARWPQRTEKLREVSGRSVFLSFLLGLPLLPVIIGSGFLLGFLGKKGDIVKVFSVGFLVLFMAMAALAGLAGLATLIGERLSAPSTKAEPWRATLRGGIVLVCLISMPYLGWFALLPLCMIIGAGMMVRSLFVGAPHSIPSVAVPQAATPTMPSQLPAQSA